MLNRSDSSDARRQQLSSLMDGDLDAAGTAGACALWRQDAQSRSDWHAYHLIGDVLRSEDLASAPGRDEAFLRNLRAAIIVAAARPPDPQLSRAVDWLLPLPEADFIMPVLDYDWGPLFDPTDGSGIPTNAPPPIKSEAT